ncbi:MAG: N-formylglutamate amidohydrolase [Thermodesulfobacteriota bacterium]|nr:N-formylglutamate amidohydrolase [Thermodesulfobacteriota bacterium]
MILPFVLSLPHCSAQVPPWIRDRLALDTEEIHTSVDLGTDEIFGLLPARYVIKANFTRLVTDLNRSFHDDGEKGVIARTDYHGRPVFLAGQYPKKTVRERLLQICYYPFHEQLTRAVEDPGIKALFDCHSLEGVGPCDAPDAGNKRKDIILSNNGGKEGQIKADRGYITCAAETLFAIEQAFSDQGFSVAVNTPYRGGFITRHYGKFLMENNKFALQIEINQDLFLYPGSKRLNPESIQRVRTGVHNALMHIC